MFQPFTTPAPDSTTYDELKATIAAQLRATGHASHRRPLCPIELEAWRRGARAAARSMQRPVRTETLDETVHAWLTDWPRDEREAAIGPVPCLDEVDEALAAARG